MTPVCILDRSKPFKVTFVCEVGPPLILTVDILPGPPKVLTRTPGIISRYSLCEMFSLPGFFVTLIWFETTGVFEISISTFFNSMGSTFKLTIVLSSLSNK